MAAILVVCAVMAQVGAGRAGAAQFGGFGEGAGLFNVVKGLAYSQSNGYVYVGDTINSRVDVFDPSTGEFRFAWGWGVATPGAEEWQRCEAICYVGTRGAGAGQFYAQRGGVAVDNNAVSALDESYGDIYVVDNVNHRVEKFSAEGAFILMFGKEVDKTTGGNVCTAESGDECGKGVESGEAGAFEKLNSAGEYIAVGPSGNVYVGDQGRVQVFNQHGVFQEAMALGPEASEAKDNVQAVAVGSSGQIYVIAQGIAGVRVYEGGALVTTVDEAGKPVVVAPGAGGAFYVDEEYEASHTHGIAAYDAANKETAVFDQEGDYAGLAAEMAFVQATGTLYVNGSNRVRDVAAPSPGPVVFGVGATAEARGEATIRATVNPENESTSYLVEYGKTSAYGSSTVTETLSASFAGTKVSVMLSGLEVRDAYHYCVRATSTAGSVCEDHTVTMLPAAEISGMTVSGVSGEAATLEADVNPLGSATEYRFDYGRTSDFEAKGTFEHDGAPVSIGSSEAPVPVSLYVQELEPGTSYTYRVVAENALAPERGVEATATFTTQGAAVEAHLADGRAWELVSPPIKHAAAFVMPPSAGGLIEASEDGAKVTYISRAATSSDPQGEASPEMGQIVSSRSGTGWGSRDIATGHEAEWGVEPGRSAEYALFSPALSGALVEPEGVTPLSTLTTERTPYLRREAACTSAAGLPTEGRESGCYVPLVTASNVPEGTKFGGSPESLAGRSLRAEALTPSLGQVVLRSASPLTEGAGNGDLYEWSEGRLALVSELPEEGGACAASFGQPTEERTTRHALSPDGSRIVWTANCGEDHHLYMRDAGKTIQVDAVQAHASGLGEAKPVYQDASVNDGRIFFTDAQALTPGAEGGHGNLYVYETEENAVTDLTVPVNAGEKADVMGTLPGVSEDGEVVYLVAGGVLSTAANEYGEAAESGANNLYRIERQPSGEWAATFIARLAGQDAPDWGNEGGKENHGLSGLTARVSPDGRWLAFMSDRPLTGYDNRDVETGERDQEVFLYGATATRKLVCASCNPTGARPHGVYSGKFPTPLIDAAEVWTGQRLAGVIPPWALRRLQDGVYQPRYLSNGGRLFFDSADALVSQDINGLADVYEYEPPASAGGPPNDSCTTGLETYGAASGGCVSLISSGTSPQESAFMDASANGNDVFFLTASQLSPADTDTAYDVYDAHVCGVGWECPSTTVAALPCETASSCKAASSSTPGVEGAPPSSTFSGAGNFASAKASGGKAKKTGKGKANAKRRRKLRRALGKCRDRFRQNRHRRRLCRRHARRLYGRAAASSRHHRGAHHHHGHRRGHGR